MFLNDLTILHLSDLHFDNSGAQPFKLHEALLSDIRSQLCYSQNIVIIVTGDIVNQANYSCEDLVLHFFSELHKIVQSFSQNVKGIYFVPGNHDKERSYATSVLSNHCEPYDKQYLQTFGSFFDDCFKKYLALTKKIYSIFFDSGFDNSTFGCNQLFIGNQRYIFVRFNTAWSATGDSDRRNLKLGDFQLSAIEEKYRKTILEQMLGDNSSDFPPPVVIALAHHPLNWLTGHDEDNIQNFLIGQRGIDAQIFICGHTHTRDVINWSNNRQSLTTLSTGIGWPDETASDHSELHAYSIYVLHLDLNAIDIYVRSTNDGGTFVEDYRLYTREENRKHSKIVLPLSSAKVHSYFELGTIGNRSPKVNFLSNDFITETERFIDSLGSFRQMAIQEIHFRKKSSALSENRKYLDFNSYIQVLCDGFGVNFLQDYPKEGQHNIRFHFRCLSLKKDGSINYPELCSSYWPDSKDAIRSPMKVFTFSELIQASFYEQHPLICSANPEVCSTSTSWYDFITAIPICEENIYHVTEKRDVKNYPIITFGVSIASPKYKSFLYCLDYYRIDRVLSSILHLYAEEIPISFLEFSKELPSLIENN